MLIYVGGYTSEPGEGIAVFDADPITGALVETFTRTTAVDPSFLAWNPAGDRLYAVSESTGGALAFARTETGLVALGEEWTGGVDPCHLVVDPSGSFLIIANYTSGSVSVHPIAADGSLAARRDLLTLRGSGPHPERQAGPHAHQIAYRPERGSFFVSDLGSDTVHEYALSSDGAVQPLGASPLTPGCGPRHIAFHPSNGLAYVAGELDSSVRVCRVRPGGLSELGSVPGTVTAVETNYPSHIRCSADGRFVYMGNRGADCLTVFAVTGETLTPLADVPTGGAWPRHFEIVGDFVYVANQDSNTVTALRIDPATGIPRSPAVVAEVPGAACILPALS
ncbi:lactonase family protein [Hamadaea tsunoensis]|uniref:lactonase family protein n=1 Tax=Hamadaea tsunoensis TaxID=53368 RepID=UPI00041CEBC8|nr:lactonase family protein [Hamadaea tsunoensis]